MDNKKIEKRFKEKLGGSNGEKIILVFNPPTNDSEEIVKPFKPDRGGQPGDWNSYKEEGNSTLVNKVKAVAVVLVIVICIVLKAKGVI